ncbi:MAG: outer membrane beta-barrel protein, partial [Nitrospiraceae bacterium]
RVGTEYSKVTPGWKARVSGGVTVLDPGNVVFFSGGLFFSADYGPSTVIRVAVSRRIAPSFFAISGALISTIAEVSLDYRLSKVLTLTGTANYGLNELTPVNLGKFTSFTTSVRLTYRLTRTLYTSLGYEYNDFRLNRPGTIFEDFDVLRNIVTFSITTRWN